MARDMAKKAISDLRSQQKHYKVFGMKIRRDSGILEAMDENYKRTGIAPSTYARIALCEKLIRDGYPIAESQNAEE